MTMTYTYSGRILNAEDWVRTRKGKLLAYKESLQEKTKLIDEAKQKVAELEVAKWLMSEASKRTQKQLKTVIETLVTSVISVAFPDRAFRFVLSYDIKKGKPSAQPLVQESDFEPEVPKDDMGVSILDFISFASQLVLLSMERPRRRKMMWMDEPFRDVGKGPILIRAAETLKEVTRSIHYQLIIITHEEDLAQVADRTFSVEYVNGRSSILRFGSAKEDKQKKQRIRLDFD